MDISWLGSMLNGLVLSHGYASLSRIFDLSAYAYPAAALLFLPVLFRRQDVARRFATAAIAALLVTSGTHWLRDSIRDRVGIARLEVLSSMDQRPADPWPRGATHVLLGRVGSPESEKAYLEPGGSFSPAPGSFGVSFWVVDQKGGLIATSDGVPLEQTRATYELSAAGEPAIRVETAYYTALWTAKDDGSFDLTLTASMKSEGRVDIVFRGVGPAAGPLTKIELAGEVLLLNGEWSAGPLTKRQLAYLGEEGSHDWKRATDKKVQGGSVRSAAGWAVARLSPESIPVSLTLRNITRQQTVATLPHLRLPITLHGLDPRFAASLDAQIVTLGLGLVGDETRPGEPWNYPLGWLRDGAYVVVALARGGQHEIATRLALAAAPKDFFGGFGAEADSPGLGIWMLTETAAVAGSPGFDRAIWPHVERKVRLLLQMLQTSEPIRHQFEGPVVPQYAGRSDLTAVAGPSRKGLIDGRMDWHKPLLYINAVSYAGLIGAAGVAERLGEAGLASEWRRIAMELKRSWNQAFLDPAMSRDAENDRTAISGLWPTSIAERASFERLMNRRWESQAAQWSDPNYVPPWTYFSVAEAHQWCQLDRPERTWAILDHLWKIQPFPDLYTLWEGLGEENSFGNWRSVRGWVSPPNVVPHYWAAAEMLLLQLAMLAEVRGEGPTGELVIGAGVPFEWLSRKLLIKGIGTSIGSVDWTWDGVDVSVTLSAPSSLPIRLGKSFPASAKIEIK